MILNLAHIEKSDIKYNIFRFPDGEPQIEILSPLCNLKDDIIVKCRICNPEDLFILMQAMDILDRNECCISLEIYYLMGARMDRLMSYTRPVTKKIIDKILKGFECDIAIIEPHSDICFHNFTDWIMNKVTEKYALSNSYAYQLIAPDHGAIERYDKLEFSGVGTKVRDVATGKITGFEFKQIETFTKPILIVDDLCDGGGTFLGLAQKIREYTDVPMDIFVTHMVNQKGIENLSKTFRNVIFTNSYKDWDNLPDNCTMIEII